MGSQTMFQMCYLFGRVAHAQRSHCTLMAGLSIPGVCGQSHCAHSAVPSRNCVTVCLFKEAFDFLNVDNISAFPQLPLKPLYLHDHVLDARPYRASPWTQQYKPLKTCVPFLGKP